MATPASGRRAGSRARGQLTLDDIRSGKRPPDAAARCAWWVELHNTAELVHWEQFKDGHVYYIPLSCMVPKDADNIVAAGRCVDGDSHALSAIRVMGPCIAMGAAAAHALDLAGTGSVHHIDLEKFQHRLRDNLDARRDSAMKLTADEKAMLDGSRGKAHQKAMELLVRYGEALGAERFVDTTNVAGVPGTSNPFLERYFTQPGDRYDVVYSLLRPRCGRGRAGAQGQRELLSPARRNRSRELADARHEAGAASHQPGR